MATSTILPTTAEAKDMGATKGTAETKVVPNVSDCIIRSHAWSYSLAQTVDHDEVVEHASREGSGDRSLFTSAMGFVNQHQACRFARDAIAVETNELRVL